MSESEEVKTEPAGTTSPDAGDVGKECKKRKLVEHYKRNVEVAADLLADVVAMKVAMVQLLARAGCLESELKDSMKGIPERAESTARELVARFA